jgi:hypothetical protein
MKIPAIKKLVEQYKTEELQKAEASILEEQQPEIEIEGADEGEQLTHVSAAIAVIEDMEQNGTELRQAIRNYTQRVRNSIS